MQTEVPSQSPLKVKSKDVHQNDQEANLPTSSQHRLSFSEGRTESSTRPERVCSNSKAAAGNGSSDQKVMPGGEGGNERERERQKAIKSQSVGQCDRGSAG